MPKTKVAPKKGKTQSSAGKACRVKVGQAFTANDVNLTDPPREVDSQTKARTTTILLVALLVFYGVYIAHEWLRGSSFDKIGRFIENGLLMYIGWCLGKHFSTNRQP
jgi:hypothetical protein